MQSASGVQLLVVPHLGMWPLWLTATLLNVVQHLPHALIVSAYLLPLLYGPWCSRSVVLSNGGGGEVLGGFPGGPAFGSDTVVHLVIRKSAKIDWRLAGSKVELSISAGACAGRLTEQAEAAGGVLRGAHQLLYNGEVLAAGKSLSSYGIQQGSVLELVSPETLRRSCLAPSFLRCIHAGLHNSLSA